MTCAGRAAWVACVLVSLRTGQALAAPDMGALAKEREYIERELGALPNPKALMAPGLTAEQKLIQGELLLKGKDYYRATLILSSVVDSYPGTRSAADAVWLRAEACYQNGEWLAARRDLKTIVQSNGDPKFSKHVAVALGRLIDVALRLDDVAGLLSLEKHMSDSGMQKSDPSFSYIKGKWAYAVKKYDAARSYFAEVAETSPFSPQARYFEALVEMQGASAAKGKSINYARAIAAFRKLTDAPATTEDALKVRDLGYLALGRLYYDKEDYVDATKAYGEVRKTGADHDIALYELAWVYVRMGEAKKAERTLEVLAVSDPTAPNIGDGMLLRADLLLRAGAFRGALEAYQAVRRQYEPLRARVDSFLSANGDVRSYYAKISQQQMDVLDEAQTLPEFAMTWAKEGQDGAMSFAVVDDVNLSRRMMRESEDMVFKLSELLGSPTRVKAFPALFDAERKATVLLNRIAQLRARLRDPANEEERQLQLSIRALPTTQPEFGARDDQARTIWNSSSQLLTQQSQEVDRLRALANGIRRMIRDRERVDGADRARVDAWRAELSSVDAELNQRQASVQELRRYVEAGRAQIGLGDERSTADANLRARAEQVFGGVSGSEAAGILAALRADEVRLNALLAGYDETVRARADGLRVEVEQERAKVVAYAQQLGALDNEAQDVVGHVLRRNVYAVRDRLASYVLRADVGLTQQAWEVREEEMYRVRTLQSERSKQEQLLDEELHEVLDDRSGGEGK